jgi:hypothetical protein
MHDAYTYKFNTLNKIAGSKQLNTFPPPKKIK